MNRFRLNGTPFRILCTLVALAIPFRGTATDDMAVSDACIKLEQSLQELRGINPDNDRFKPALRRVLVAPDTIPVEVFEILSMVVCSGLVAAGDNSNYLKVRTKISDLKRFEEALTEQCSRCNGTGRRIDRCNACFGSGRCKVSGCNNGQRSAPQVGGGLMWFTCFSCNGSGMCKECHGLGKRESSCSECRGVGRKISRNNATKVFSEAIGACIEKCRSFELKEIRAKGRGATPKEAQDKAIDNAVASVRGISVSRIESNSEEWISVSEGSNKTGLFESESLRESSSANRTSKMSGRVKSFKVISEEKNSETGEYIVSIIARVFKY